MCFAVPEKEAMLVCRALERKFQRDLDAGRLSRVCLLSLFEISVAEVKLHTV